MAARPNSFDDWFRHEFGAGGAFTALIVLFAIDEQTARPLRSSHVHVIGDALDWSAMEALLDGGGSDWDAVLFSPRRDPRDGGVIGDTAARQDLAEHVEAIVADRSLLNQGHFFDRKGRRLRIDEVAAQ
ncbi:hypothetical protein [Paracoccus marinaquae]|uniref:Uncharacterized protein n=1 Tax=Paracoccus marinaquae TaxID=2841926 RepID=A0ABS6AFS8_9RHOB|nr:hypothetical protein [Paracoccus marinaquae]MBU3029443.1 hypothetical protein [Paracoccus marinaquae]